MAIASVGTLLTGASGTSGNTLLLSTANAIEAGNTAVIVIAKDNTGTTDADHSEVTDVSDSGATWTKLGEFTNGQGAAAAGVTMSVWLRPRVAATLATGSTITATFSGDVTDKCCSAWEFSCSSGLVRSASPSTNATDGATGFGSSSISGLPFKSRLYIRGLAKEANSTTSITVTTNFTALSGQRSRNNASAVIVRGEFRINTSTGETSNPTLGVTGDTSGVFVALEEGFSGTAALTTGGADFSGSATFTIGFSATGAFTTGGSDFAGTATFTSPGSTGSAALVAGGADFTGVGGTAYHPVTLPLTQPHYGLYGQRYGTFAGKPYTPPFFIGEAALTVAGADFAATGVMTWPHPVTKITQPRYALFGQRYGTFADKGAGFFSAAAALIVGGADFAGSADFNPPVSAATAALTTGRVTLAATGDTNAPIYAGTAALITGGTDFAGVADFTAPVYAAADPLITGGAEFAGTAVFAANVYAGTAALTTAGADFAGTATFTPPATSTGIASLTTGGMQLTGTAAFVFDEPATGDFYLWRTSDDKLYALVNTE